MIATKKHIAGTEGTYHYAVIYQTKLGLVAVRRLNDSTYRLRVEPSDDKASTALAKVLTRNIFVDPSWKQPFDQGKNGQNRFSTLVNGNELHAAVVQAVTALRGNDDASLLSATSDWEAALTAVVAVGTTNRAELIARLRENDVPGVNSASRWTTTTLMEKASALAPNS